MEVKMSRALLAVGIPLVLALVSRFVFGAELMATLFSVMSLSFFLLVPYGVGALTIYLSNIATVRSLKYRIFMPWVPILGFLALTLLLSWEGWACWMMILPIFLVFASLGGLTAGYMRLKKSDKTNKLYLSLALLLPFLIAPVERMIGSIPGFYKAYTYIDIAAPKETIWQNVTRVRQIETHEDHGVLTNFLQIPRPIKAELDFEGVGAKREAIFEGGLIFDERVLQYDHQKRMTFSITPNTHEIPSTTFDEHILIGGKFFDVLQGTYELEPLSENNFRLHLHSEFKITTTFNFYASIWGRWIMKDIQQNILEVIKERSELTTMDQ
ncbi:hypothetical protein [Chryseolinea lacunae]|uniref:SRPBCC family protein n=1 Tax=Chryseolinea lacunae TaxID=2801331 RepID=A0ABS1L383_9BACT|nr:hypothetical protein [Chryseolinea lacunae]MBL0745962.1 hypothetical protein [Chryseolinea lacunae]